MCKITYLYTTNKHLGKQFINNGIEIKTVSYDHGYTLFNEAIDYNNLKSVFLDFQELAETRQFCFIRGNIKSEFKGQSCRRLIYDDAEKGDKATVEPDLIGKNLIMLDFDDVDNQSGQKPSEDDIEQLVVSRLPVEFHDVTFFYQFSSSAGVRGWDPFKVHLFYWTEKPLPDVELRRWAQDWNDRLGRKWLDDRVFLSSQINYIANPIFTGMADPLGSERWGFIQKTIDTVDLQPVAPKRRTASDWGARYAMVFTPDNINDSLLERLGRIGVGGQYREPLMAAIGFYIAASKRRGLVPNHGYLKAVICEQAGAVFQANGRGQYLTDRHLDDLIRWFDRHINVMPYSDAEKIVWGVKKRHENLMRSINDYNLKMILEGRHNEQL